MTEAACIVCGNVVAEADQFDHLKADHLGPHYFWVDAKRFRTMAASLTGAEIKKLGGVSPIYQLYLDASLPIQSYADQGRKKEDRGIGDGEAVSVVGEPHFYGCPPATYR